MDFSKYTTDELLILHFVSCTATLANIAAEALNVDSNQLINKASFIAGEVMNSYTDDKIDELLAKQRKLMAKNQQAKAASNN